MHEPLRLEWIIGCLEENRYIMTRHAEVERRDDGLTIAELEAALMTGTILESYAQDPRGPSCLIAGWVDERCLHIVCGRNTDDWLVIITVYVPSMPKWRTWNQRNLS